METKRSKITGERRNQEHGMNRMKARMKIDIERKGENLHWKEAET